MGDAPKITCRACKSKGPFSAVRHVAQVRDLADEYGDASEWEFGNSLNGRLWICCGSCGHSWRTRRIELEN